MRSTHVVKLAGCTPEPLMSYLKALGVLRLVSEQVDTGALGAWRGERFDLHSTLDEGALLEFFFRAYSPTPILAPWNAGCGLYKKWNPKKGEFKPRDAVLALTSIESSTADRLKPYRDAITAIKQTLRDRASAIDPAEEVENLRRLGAREGWSQKQLCAEIQTYLAGMLLFELDGQPMKLDREDKDRSVLLLRNRALGDSALRWLDASMIIAVGRKKNRIEAPLLGSGGNIGNSEFSARVMQVLPELIPLNEGDPVPELSELFLRASLLGEPTSQLLNLAVDQFAPGMAGGANMGQGPSGAPLLNPWDYVLMMEGALLMSGSSTRRLQAGDVRSAFPFVVDSSPVGFASATEGETPRELWLPLWSRFASLQEIGLLLSEGRSQVGRRHPQNAVEFAVAVASLAVDRGIESFSRIQFQKRLGDNYLATNVGRIAVRPRESIPLVVEVETWLSTFRQSCSGRGMPPRLIAAARRIESKIFDYCRYGDPSDLLGVLITLGGAEHELAVTGGQRGNKPICRPIQALSSDWIDATNDGSPEFEIALALGSIHNWQDEQAREASLPIRANLEPVRREGSAWVWGKEGPSVVWKNGSLVANMAAVLNRRLLDGRKLGIGKKTLGFHHSVRTATVARFLAGETDDRRIEELLWALVLVQTAGARDLRFTSAELPPPLPRAFALLKPLFLPRPIRFENGRWQYAKNDVPIKLEPRVLPLVRADRVPEACEIAARRLFVSGLKPMPGPTASGSMRQVDAEIKEGLDPTRLAASLLLPMNGHELDRLLRLVTRSPEETPVLERQGVE